MDKLDEIDAKIDQLLQYNADKIDNNLLKLQIGELSVKIDVLMVKNDAMKKVLVEILSLAELGRPDQDHMPTIVKLAKKGLE